jgi:hypothetical protein
VVLFFFLAAAAAASKEGRSVRLILSSLFWVFAQRRLRVTLPLALDDVRTLALALNRTT